MKLAEDIRRLGFKRWYERILIQSHVYLVLAIVGLIVFFGGMEMLLGPLTGVRMFIGVVATVAGGIATVTGVQQYAKMMIFAHRLSDRATCEGCGVYAAFQLLDAGPRSAKPADDQQQLSSVWLKVKCDRCGHEWTL